MMSQRVGRAEAGRSGNALDRDLCCLQQFPGPQYTCLYHPFAWRQARCFLERSNESAPAHARLGGKARDRQLVVQMMLRPCKQGRERIVLSLVDRLCYELRLPAFAVWRNDEPLRHAVGDLSAIIASDNVKTQIEARRRCRRSAPG